jgi:fluoroacetyl-CoA thioesterase
MSVQVMGLDAMSEEGGISEGLAVEVSEQVSPSQTASHVGSGGLRVYATPAMVRFVERSCFRLLEARLPKGKTTVGVEIQLQHLAPTPVDKEVHLRAEVTAVVDNRVEFHFEVQDDLEVVGRGKHTRAIIDLDRFLARVKSKSEQLT